MISTNKIIEEARKVAHQPEVCNCELGLHIVWDKDEDGYISISKLKEILDKNGR